MNEDLIHTFLRLHQPIPDELDREPKILRKGHPYIIPFRFIVPAQLLPQCCDHLKRDSAVEKVHTELPPSLGDLIVFEKASKKLDDLAPSICQISYKIKVSISRRSSSWTRDCPSEVIAAHARKVYVVPTVHENLPPYEESLAPQISEAKDVTVWQGLRKSMIGRLSLFVPLPKSIQINLSSTATPTDAHTSILLNLRFDSSQEATLPTFDKLQSELKVLTSCGISPLSSFYPSILPRSGEQKYQRTFKHDLQLPCLSISSVSWDKCEDKPSDQIFQAQILLPVTLPVGLALVPTFQTCNVSRMYVLRATLSYRTSTSTKQYLRFEVPIHITAAK